MCRCWTNVCTAAVKVADGHPGEDERAARPRRAGGAAERVGDDDRGDRAGERGERHDRARPGRGDAVDDRERRPEPRAARDAEQVRVGERVAEDALVGGAGDGEHAADERREHDPRRAQLPEHRVLDRVERRVHVQERDVGERRLDDRAGADPDRARRRARRAASRGGRRPPRAPSAGRPRALRRAAAASVPTASTAAMRLLPPRDRGDGARELDDARPPARGDVVVDRDHAMLRARRRASPSPAGPPRSSRSGRSTSSRRARRSAGSAARMYSRGELRIAGVGGVGGVRDVAEAEQLVEPADERRRRGRVVRLVELVVERQMPPRLRDALDQLSSAAPPSSGRPSVAFASWPVSRPRSADLLVRLREVVRGGLVHDLRCRASASWETKAPP